MKRTIEDINVQGKRVLLRVDFNVPLDDSGNIVDASRIQKELPTIKYLLAKGARLIICSHLGRPKGQPNPNMSMLAIKNGADKPAEIDDEAFEQVKKDLFALKGQESAIFATPSDVIQSLANGSSWIGVMGEWLRMSLACEGYPIEISIPETGAMSWAECVGIVEGAKNQEAAEAWIKYIISPEAQAKLAWADCYHAPVPNKKAAEYLTEEQIEILEVFDEEKTEYILNHLVDRQLPADEKKWESVWTEFKTMK